MEKIHTMTVKEWVECWKQKQKPYLKTSTYATYSNEIANHIIPFFGQIKITEINHEINQQFILYLSQNGRCDKRGGLSAKTVRDIFCLWLSILRDAEREEYMICDDKKYKYPVLNQTVSEKCLTREQENKIFIILEKNLNPRNLGILLALTTGMRIGEICGLQWGDINLHSNTVAIRKTLQRIYTKEGREGVSQILISGPKSLNANRDIPLSSKMVKMLKKYRKSDASYFLTGKEGKFIEPRSYREYYNRLMRKHNVWYVSFHGLRHTFATRCIEAGCDCKTLSEILGHADVNTTMRLYVHTSMEKKRNCIEKMQSSL